MTNSISEITRRNVFDALRLAKVRWAGRLAETAFLSRVFDLEGLPSTDYRRSNMLGDISQHRENFLDWDDDWVYDDQRLNLLRGPDDKLLNFLAEMIHPIVRDDEDEVNRLLELFNRHLGTDGFQLVVVNVVSGRRIFAASRTLGLHGQNEARKLADSLASDHIAAQITRMQTSIVSDPALAIGSAKEFIESICKGILADRRQVLTGKEDLPRLVHLVRETLGINVGKRTDDTLKSTLRALATIIQGVAELRGQLGTGHGDSPDAPRPPVEIARLAVGIATTAGVFLWDMHQKSRTAGAGPGRVTSP